MVVSPEEHDNTNTVDGCRLSIILNRIGGSTEERRFPTNVCSVECWISNVGLRSLSVRRVMIMSLLLAKMSKSHTLGTG